MKKLLIFISLIIAMVIIYALINPGFVGDDKPEQNQNSQPEEHSEDGEKEHRQLQVEDMASLYPDLVIRSGNRDKPFVALTFDDGPDSTYTPQILNILKEKGVPATFFITGIRAEKNTQVLKKIENEGHEIGIHGYEHKKFSAMEKQEIKDELIKMENLIRINTGKPLKNKLFRPPFGALDPQSVKTIGNMGYKIILWNIDSLDWSGLNANQIKENVLPEIKNGAIILFHSGAGPGEDLSGTVQVLGNLIDTIKKKGFRFVKISEMIKS